MSDSGDTEAEGSSTTNLAESDKNESKKKIIRLLTVMAYVSSVSGTAFMLSMYYLFLWEPKVAEHHLKASPNSHQALALQDHGREAVPRSPWPAGPLPGAHDPWPPAPRDANSFAPYRPAAKFDGYSQGPYHSLPPLVPVTAPDRRPQYPAYWEHPVPGPQPRRPPSLSLVREPLVPLPLLRQPATAAPTSTEGRHLPSPADGAPLSMEIQPSQLLAISHLPPTTAAPKPITPSSATSAPNLVESTNPPLPTKSSPTPTPASTRQYSTITAKRVSANSTLSTPKTADESRGADVDHTRLPSSTRRPSSSPASPVAVNTTPPPPPSAANRTAMTTHHDADSITTTTSPTVKGVRDAPQPADPTEQPAEETTATPTAPTGRAA